MDAKTLRDLFRSGDSYLVTSYRGEAGSIKEADNLILRALDILAEVEGSQDEIVQELNQTADNQTAYGFTTTMGVLCREAAAALVAERAAKEKAEAERDELKRHAEAFEDSPLPCNVVVNHTVVNKGCKVRTALVAIRQQLKYAQPDVSTNSAAHPEKP